MTLNPLGTVSLMLTLAGLVGSFFNIQLSQWLRDLMALERKVFLNKAHGNEAQQKAIVECRIEHRKLAASESYAIHAAVLAFVLFVLVNGLVMLQAAKDDPLFGNVQFVLLAFLLFFAAMAGWLLWRGRVTDQAIRTILAEIKP